MFEQLEAELDPGLKKELFFEVIFMTYGLANEKILSEAMPNALKLLDRITMRPKGRGKYCYRQEFRSGAEDFVLRQIKQKFPLASISYVC